jgi:hypothetical protein
MHDGLQNLLARLKYARDSAAAIDDDQLYLDLVDVCAYCEALMVEAGGETVDVETFFANFDRRHLHVVSSKKSG